MRSAALLLALVATSFALVAAAPNAGICSSNSVQLELRPSSVTRDAYQLSFINVDPQQGRNKNTADFIDIHYRVNNDDSVNLRVLTEQAFTTQGANAKQAQVDNIQMDAGDVLRAYATYSTQGIACDTPIHTFNAPDRSDMRTQSVPQYREPTRRQTRTVNTRSINGGTIVNQPMRTMAMEYPTRGSQRRMAGGEDEFWTLAAAEAEANHAAGACPAIAMDQDILKISGLRDSYVLSFENKTPGKQLHYVDLHLTTDGAANGWDNLRLASDMQLSMAHKVLQPGVVIKDNEALSFYWSYRTSSADGIVIDCTSPVTTITPQQITHSVELEQLAAMARN